MRDADNVTAGRGENAIGEAQRPSPRSLDAWGAERMRNKEMTYSLTCGGYSMIPDILHMFCGEKENQTVQLTD